MGVSHPPVSRRSVGNTSKQPYFHLSACRRSSRAGIQSAIQGEWVFTRRIEDCAKPKAPGVSQAALEIMRVQKSDSCRLTQGISCVGVGLASCASSWPSAACRSLCLGVRRVAAKQPASADRGERRTPPPFELPSVVRRPRSHHGSAGRYRRRWRRRWPGVAAPSRIGMPLGTRGVPWLCCRTGRNAGSCSLPGSGSRLPRIVRRLSGSSCFSSPISRRAAQRCVWPAPDGAGPPRACRGLNGGRCPPGSPRFRRSVLADDGVRRLHGLVVPQVGEAFAGPLDLLVDPHHRRDLLVQSARLPAEVSEASLALSIPVPV